MFTHQQSHSSVKPICVEFENIRNELKKISPCQTHVYLLNTCSDSFFFKQTHLKASLFQ